MTMLLILPKITHQQTTSAFVSDLTLTSMIVAYLRSQGEKQTTRLMTSSNSQY
jgi:hypothetical protein